jgi:hypothetical protein
MYYTTTGSYRRAKMIIDYVNIVLCVFVAVMAVMILFLRSDAGILFPITFAAGGTVNLLFGIKKLLNQSKRQSVSLFAAAALIYVLAILCFGVAM